MQRQPGVVQCFREASVADAEAQKANAGPFRVKQGQHWAERG